MREIKFRAWKHVGTPEMFNDVRAINFEKGTAILGYRVSGWTIREDIESLDNLKLMQYTGLTDKNGVVVYEGDIVKKPYYSDRRRKINGEIKFIDGEFVTDFIDYDQSLRMATDIEVIGNIYEHPKLVDAK